MKKLIFNTWSGAYFKPGGGEVQLESSKKHLEMIGYSIERFNQWCPQYDFDIFHQFSVANGVEHSLLSYKEAGKKIVLSTILWDDFPKDSWDYQRIKLLFDNSDLLFTNSDLESKRLSRAFETPIKKFHKTRNSIAATYQTKGDPTLFRKKFSIDGDFVLSVANIDKRKNTKSLVEACDYLGKKLVLIGHIRDIEYYNSFRDKYSNFIYLGSITNQNLLKSAYKACRVFALPSFCETPGLAALEAASQGASIVITQEGAAPEYLPDAIFTNPYDNEDLIEAITKGWEREPNLKECNELVSNFSWENTAKDIALGYEKLFL
ncbi:MAG: hypothetical protein CMJ16_03200 [Peredibacter sp.]|nr:hypothetical protein [Peredibacter sp.]